MWQLIKLRGKSVNLHDELDDVKLRGLLFIRATEIKGLDLCGFCH
jgi:hypothetical protein